MLIRRIRQTNLLSFGPDSEEIELKRLNVLIGPNGSGKSNLLESIDILRSAPRDLVAPIREGGGIHDWIWRGKPEGAARIEAIAENPQGSQALRYRLGFAERGQRFELIEERIENEQSDEGHEEPYIYYNQKGGQAFITYKDETGVGPTVKEKYPHVRLRLGQYDLRPEEVKLDQSILSQRKDPDLPELTYLGEVLSRIRIYREWSLGRDSPLRLPQKADLPNEFLQEDGKNLALVLNKFQDKPAVERRLMDALRKLYEGITGFYFGIEGSTVQLFLREGDVVIPATRLSDGTLRYLCLLAVLCHPEPPPLICIEEPELGLHPDILPTVSKLLLEASERSQLIVTTHSDMLVDALTNDWWSIVVCEKHDGQTVMRRLDEEKMAAWLENYRLGELWSSGEIGGNPW
ncbi:MAG: AAA family ATPase [Gemmatimonadetes bacterium]|nr:AAA family ATPase [Gemmatimonadota bacterium]MYB69169.1 AAA family ATPase [Gemmatimonadota bacterium]